jgi:hypothetical protein
LPPFASSATLPDGELEVIGIDFEVPTLAVALSLVGVVDNTYTPRTISSLTSTDIWAT